MGGVSAPLLGLRGASQSGPEGLDYLLTPPVSLGQAEDGPARAPHLCEVGGSIPPFRMP